MNIPPSYLKSIEIEDIKCFKNKHFLDLSDGKNKPAQWTVILGNNGTGKTTLLQCISLLEPRFLDTISEEKESSISIDTVPRGIMDKKDRIFRSVDSVIFYGDKLKGNDFKNIRSYFSQGTASVNSYNDIGGLQIYCYGASRRLGKGAILGKDNPNKNSGLFEDNELINSEEWLMQTDYAVQKENNKNALTRLEKVKKILVDILPDVQNFEFKTTSDLKNYVEFKTDYGNVRLRDLSYGYQTMIAWIVDFAKNLFERYPDSDNALSEPAIVLVDEIDLHMHPMWQHNIISYLSSHFPNTQFIVTSHSPLVVQSAEQINLVLLQKNKKSESVTITNHVNVTYKGWTVEEILNDLMGLEKTVSDKYVELMTKFTKAIESENGEEADKIYTELDKILHPDNYVRKLLRLQMTTLKQPS